VHVLLIFFLLDVIFGYWAARRLRKERFSVKIIWNHTIPRMLISIVLIIGAFMWDNTYNMDMISTYKLIGWFISGVILYSIAENGYKITKWSVFPKIGNLLNKGVKEKTGMDVNEKEEEKC
jgi:multisubunit Na+/H+ antiporter MnhF subunit